MSSEPPEPSEADRLLAAAWTFCAPDRSQAQPFPTGFWPDVARVAIEMCLQNTLQPTLDFRPTRASRRAEPPPKRPVDLSQLEL